MIRVSVFYPNEPGARFDHQYYSTTHVQLINEKLRPGLVRVEIDRGVGGESEGAPAPYTAVGHLIFESVEAFGSAMAAHGDALAADMPNYTDLKPSVQISEILHA